MDAREAVLRAVGPPSGGTAPPSWGFEQRGGIAEFEANFRLSGGEIVGAEDLARLPGRRWSRDRDVGTLQEEWGEYTDASPWDADLGITRCDALVPETGSIVVSSAPGRGRLTSLVVPIHLVWADRGLVVANLEEALGVLGPRSAVIVTGPSRSADIEGVMIRGVHGPRRLLLVWR